MHPMSKVGNQSSLAAMLMQQPIPQYTSRNAGTATYWHLFTHSESDCFNWAHQQHLPTSEGCNSSKS